MEEELSELSGDLDLSTEELADLPGGMQNPDTCSVTSSLDILPSTCTVEAMRGNGCSFQVPLQSFTGGGDLRLQVAVSKCPATLLPFTSVRLAGAGAYNLLAPCATDAQCGTGQRCFDFAKALTTMPDDVNPYDELAHNLIELLRESAFELRDPAVVEAQVAAQDFGSSIMTAVRFPLF